MIVTKKCWPSAPTFLTLRAWKRTLPASDSRPTPRTAKSDFLSVAYLSVGTDELIRYSRRKRSKQYEIDQTIPYLRSDPRASIVCSTALAQSPLKGGKPTPTPAPNASPSPGPTPVPNASPAPTPNPNPNASPPAGVQVGGVAIPVPVLNMHNTSRVERMRIQTWLTSSSQPLNLNSLPRWRRWPGTLTLLSLHNNLVRRSSTTKPSRLTKT
jgi:hypothetical protein